MSDAITTAGPRPPAGAPEPERPPPVVWDAEQRPFLVFFVFLAILVAVLWPSAVLWLLRAAGFFNWFYPVEPTYVEARQHLWGLVLAFPFQVATILVLAFAVLDARPSALGLHGRRGGRNLLVGLASAAILTPVVLYLHLAVVWLHIHGFNVVEEKHPLALAGKMHLTPVEWAVWFFAAVVAAPVVEELLFRGVFQPAAGRTRWGGLVGVALSGAVAGLFRYRQIADSLQLLRDAGSSTAALAFLDATSPLLFVAVLVPVHLLVQWRARDRVAPAVLGTSVLFAMVHVSVWPSPVALFVLALGLGWLKELSGSLVGPIVLHALFNGASCALVILGVK